MRYQPDNEMKTRTLLASVKRVQDLRLDSAKNFVIIFFETQRYFESPFRCSLMSRVFEI